MEDLAPRPAPRTWRQNALSGRALAAAGVGLLLGALGAGAGWLFWLKPQRDAAERRFGTSRDVLALYALQMKYKDAKGVYAPDLDSLLGFFGGGEGLRRRMARHLDMATLTVAGDAARFKIEANVLDQERTLVKIKGPIDDKRPAREAPPLPSGQAPALPDAGAPVNAP